MKSFSIFLTLFFLLFSIGLVGQEVCNNGIDDDGDGLIDLNDVEECSCNEEWPWSFSVIDLACHNPPFFSLATDPIDGASYQWYKDGIAISDETDPIFLPIFFSSGTYVLIVDTGNNCYSSPPYVFETGTIRTEITDTLCIDETYTFGDREISFPGTYSGFYEAANGCDSIVNLTLELHDCGDTIRTLKVNFKNKLISVGVDTNNDGRIQYTEAAAVDTLDLAIETFSPEPDIRDFLGLEYFYNLQYLDIEHHDAFRIPLDSLKRLKHLNIANNNTDNLDISKLDSIEYLNLSFNSFRNFFDVSHLKRLKFYINHANRMNIIDLSENQELIEIDLTRDLTLDSLYLSDLPNLKKFSASLLELPELNLTGAPNLETLILSQSNIESGINLEENSELKFLEIRLTDFQPDFDARHMEDLRHLHLEQTGLLDIDLSNNIKLAHLNLHDNLEFEGIDLSDNINLITLDLTRCELRNHILDLSNNSNLDSLSVFQVRQLLINNGSIERYLDISFDVWYEYVCVDPEQYTTVRDIIYREVPVNSFCFFEEEGASNSFTGAISLSANGIDCSEVMNNSPSIKLFVEAENTNGFIFIDEDQRFRSSLPDGDLCIHAEVESSEYFDAIPEEICLNFPEDGNSRIQDYCIVAKEEVADVTADLLPISDARPGFNSNYKIVYKNLGTLPVSGTVVLEFEEEVLSFMDIDSLIFERSGSEITWTFEDLQVFETREIYFDMLVNSPMDDPPLLGGDTLNYTLNIHVENDAELSDNIDTLAQEIVNSFDPNDKICIQGGEIPQFETGPFLRYRIRFENTGTADAVHVVVKDFIDPVVFDISTIRPLDSSHEYDFKVVDNVAEFIFSEINLSFQKDNNDGFIYFEVKLKDNLSPGELIENTAEIFFDFNLPIITNTVETSIFQETVSAEQLVEYIHIKIHPNVSNENIKIIANGILRVSVFGINGNQITDSYYDNAVEVNYSVSNFENGIYFIKIWSTDEVSTHKIIKI